MMRYHSLETQRAEFGPSGLGDAEQYNASLG